MLAAAREAAETAGVPLWVLTFEPHPVAVLQPERAWARLVTPDEKLALLARAGAAAVIVLASCPALFATPPEEFIARLKAVCRPQRVVEGPTFTFGRGKAGTVDTLRTLGAQHGFAVEVVPQVQVATDAGPRAVSSSAVRVALLEGRVDEAATMLGRPYRIAGRVGHGAGRGAQLGFPTANLEGVPHLLPQPGVYAALAQLPDGQLVPAGVNVGTQPTFSDATPRVEAHLLDFAGDLRGEVLGLHFLRWLRGQERFEDQNALRARVQRDLADVRAAATVPPEAPWDFVLPELSVPSGE
jgi:riboflavin kinase/FMN adenylyltransferase